MVVEGSVGIVCVPGGELPYPHRMETGILGTAGPAGRFPSTSMLTIHEEA